jgi:hypothetical protein
VKSSRRKYVRATAVLAADRLKRSGKEVKIRDKRKVDVLTNDYGNRLFAGESGLQEPLDSSL